MTSTKVLVVGAVNGQFKKSFERVNKLHAKQNFAFALIVGDLFDPSEENDELEHFFNGSLTVSLPTYFTVGDAKFPDRVTEKLQNNDEVCPNLIYLGRKGTFTTSDGIRIVFLGGRLVQNERSLTQALGKCDPLFLESDVRALHGAHSAHILITNKWPANITKLSNVPLPEKIESSAGVQSIARLCSTLKPWYHFSASPDSVWEREPFKHTEEYDSLEELAVTRFKALGGVNASSKEWMTAFALDIERPPKAENPGKSPLGDTLGGSQSRKRSAPSTNGHSQYSRYDTHDSFGYSGRPSKRAREVNNPNDCFMCLNKPGFKAHMVVSIGDESMITVLRGPLPLPDTFSQLSFSGHIMIIPFYHAADAQAQGRRSAKESGVEFAEMTKYRKAINNMVGSKSQGQLGSVCWEVNRSGIRHLHWQLVALPADQVRKGLVEAAFKVLGEKRGYSTFRDCDPEQQLEERSEFFRVWTWSPTADPVKVADQVGSGVSEDAGMSRSFFFPLPLEETNFNIWFGREVMAGLLRLEDRVNWKATMRGDEITQSTEEEQDANGMKQDFAEFDFAMQ